METSPYRISIVIPVYNVSAYIEECLDSIAAQTYKGDVECILVDDCSTDDSREKMTHYINGYSGEVQFKTIFQKENGRQGTARNAGVAQSTGDYILFVDSDDTITPDCLKVMVSALAKHPTADYVLCAMKDQDDNHFITLADYPEFTDDKNWLMHKSLFPEGGLPAGPANRLIRMSLLTDNNIIFPPKVIFEDVQFTFLIGLFARSACFCQEATYVYRACREGSTVTTIARNEDFLLTSRLTVMENLCARVTEEQRQLQLRALMCRYILYHTITPKTVLAKHDRRFSAIGLQLYAKAKGTAKAIIGFYLMLPKCMQQSDLVKRVFNKILYKL